jgi:hypothetical protein
MEIKVGWFPGPVDESVASYRLRCERPSSALWEHGFSSEIHPTNFSKVNVFSKNSDLSQLRSARSLGRVVVFDLCDNYLTTDHRMHVRIEQAIECCDVVTVPTSSMKDVVGSRFPGKRCSVIPDMLEFNTPRHPSLSGVSESLIWFGNFGKKKDNSGVYELSSALFDLSQRDADLLEPFKQKYIISKPRRNLEWLQLTRDNWTWNKWSPNWFQDFGIRNLCFLPSTANEFTKVKSPNRALTAVMLGFPVYCFGNESFQSMQAINIGRTIGDSVDFVLGSRTTDLVERVKQAQYLVRDEFSDDRIIRLWIDLFNSI